MAINAQYNTVRPDSAPAKLALYQRRKMFSTFLECSITLNCSTVLDIGVTSDRSYDHSNYLEAWYPQKERITAIGLDDAGFLKMRYPGITLIRGDGRDLPFKDRSFDIVHSSAVLEHVGSRERQRQFLHEAWRVARKGIFVTTPNRWFPIEFHTLLPLAHWLPAPAFRGILKGLRKGFFAREENLNILSRRDLAQLAREVGIEQFDIRVVALLGWPTNLLLYAKRSAAEEAIERHCSSGVQH
jgi:hypothetical protein